MRLCVCGPEVALTQQRRRVGTFFQLLLRLFLRLLGRPGDSLYEALRRGRAVPVNELLVLGKGERVVHGADIEDDGDGDVEETQQHQQLAGPLEPAEGAGRVHGHWGPLVPSRAEPSRTDPLLDHCTAPLLSVSCCCCSAPFWLNKTSQLPVQPIPPDRTEPRSLAVRVEHRTDVLVSKLTWSVEGKLDALKLNASHKKYPLITAFDNNQESGMLFSG